MLDWKEPWDWPSNLALNSKLASWDSCSRSQLWTSEPLRDFPNNIRHAGSVHDLARGYTAHLLSLCISVLDVISLVLDLPKPLDSVILLFNILIL